MNFFAGANSRYGFYSCFESVFAGVERLFIIKGSSGCGKSTLMRKIAQRAENSGLEVDYIFCSADTDSLDGIVIPKKGIAVADGTSPHILEVKYPCVRESIINLGDFWQEAKLLPQKNKIFNLTDLKGCFYKNAYQALAAAGNLRELQQNLINQCLNRKKTDALAERHLKQIDIKKGRLVSAFASAITCKGIFTIEAVKSPCRVYKINGLGGEALLKSIVHTAAEQEAECVVFSDPLDPKLPQCIYFSTGVAFTVRPQICNSAEDSRTLSTQGLLNKAELDKVKTKLKGLGALEQSLTAEAVLQLWEAKEAHNRIEDIYISAMDFKAVDDFTEKFIKKLFDE